MSKKSILGFLQLNVLGGASFLFFLKGYFVISSYFIYSSLPRLLPKEEVGIYFVVNNIVAVINAIFVIVGAPGLCIAMCLVLSALVIATHFAREFTELKQALHDRNWRKVGLLE